jgi:hypothetical protein
LTKDATSTDRYVAGARLLLSQLDRDGSSPPTPTRQVWRSATACNWSLLGGEAVVDYSSPQAWLGPQTWVAAYSERRDGVHPVARVLAEGGYGAAARWYITACRRRGRPEVEEKIVSEVHRLAGVALWRAAPAPRVR